MTVSRRFLPTPPRTSGRSWEDVAPELHRFLELMSRVSFGNSIHSSMADLDADDHLQYIRVDGTRDFTGDQDMGDNSLTGVESVQFDVSPTVVPTAPGSLYWDEIDKTLAVVLNDDVTMQVGQEDYTLVLNHNLGYTLLNGRVVKFTGVQGQRVTADYANATVDADVDATIGIVTEDIENNTQGYVTTRGIIRNVDTSAWSEGDQLYLTGTAGQISNVRPTKPSHCITLGVVLLKANNGQIFIYPRRYYDIEQLNDVSLATPATGDILTYSAATAVWSNTSPGVVGASDQSILACQVFGA